MVARISFSIAIFLAAPAWADGDAIPGSPSPDPPLAAVLADVPFEPYPEPNRVVIDLAPEGQTPFPLMLDTGATASAVTPRLARSLGVSVRRTKSTPYRKATRLGRDLQFWVLTRRGDTASNVAFEFGLLGMDFLDDYVLEIDFPGRRVRFIDPQAYRVPDRVSSEDEGITDFRRVGTRIGVEIEMNGRRGLVLLDTGAPGNLLISGKLATKLGVDVNSLPKAHEHQGTTGPIAVRSYETDTFRIAGFQFGAMPVTVAPKGWYNIAGPTDSVVGYDVFAQFVVRFDFERNTIWMRRIGEPRVTQYGADYALVKRVGVVVGSDGEGFRVYEVEPEGIGERFGLRAGDQILTARGGRAESVDDVLVAIEAGDRLTLARKEGNAWIEFELPDEDLATGWDVP